MKRPSWLVVILVIAALSIPAVSLAVSASKVTLNFMCPCGSCDEALSTCECPSSDGYRSQIAGMLGSGYSEEQIIEDFKGRFGPEVLIANAAMAPNAGGRTFDKKVFGFILLILSFSLAAFGLGKYMRPAPVPARRREKGRRTAPDKKPDKPRRRSGSGKRFREGVDDELLDDYDYK